LEGDARSRHDAQGFYRPQKWRPSSRYSHNIEMRSSQWPAGATTGSGVRHEPPLARPRVGRITPQHIDA
jgi:hypothetical protein